MHVLGKILYKIILLFLLFVPLNRLRSALQTPSLLDSLQLICIQYYPFHQVQTSRLNQLQALTAAGNSGSSFTGGSRAS